MVIEKKYIWQMDNWPNYYFKREQFMDSLLKIAKLQGHFQGIFSLMNKDSLLKARAEIMSDDAINTSAIEGEILSRDSVRSSINKKLGIDSLKKDKSTTQTDGLIQILNDLSQNFEQPLDKKRLFGWHAALFPTGYSGLQKIRVASFRGATPMQIVSGPAGKEKVHYIAPPGKMIDSEMKCFIKWLNTDQEKNGVIKSAIAHLWFVAIHPFEDGNGRLARAVSDYILSKFERMPFRFYSLSTFIYQNRKDYYRVLEKTTDYGLDITFWIEWYLRIILQAMENSDQIFEKIIFKTRFWNHFTDTVLNNRQKKVLNKMLDVGRGQFEGGINTRKYAHLNRVSKPTAARELKDLVNKGLLVLIPGTRGRNISYQLFENS